MFLFWFKFDQLREGNGLYLSRVFLSPYNWNTCCLIPFHLSFNALILERIHSTADSWFSLAKGLRNRTSYGRRGGMVGDPKGVQSVWIKLISPPPHHHKILKVQKLILAKILLPYNCFSWKQGWKQDRTLDGCLIPTLVDNMGNEQGCCIGAYVRWWKPHMWGGLMVDSPGGPAYLCHSLCWLALTETRVILSKVSLM